MIRKHASLILALAALASASAFAEGGMVSSTGGSVSSGTGLIVGQGAPSSSVTVLPSTSVAVQSSGRLLPGAAQVQASQTTVLGGPAPGISGSKTVVTDYWINVPANAETRADFQRWQNLR